MRGVDPGHWGHVLTAPELYGKPIPLVCTPLVGCSRDQILAELAVVLAKRPDILEWRVDFFERLAHVDEVIGLAETLKNEAGNVRLLFTRRCAREGGQKIVLSEDDVVALYQTICDSRQIDLIDFEMGNDPEHIALVREAAKANDIKLVLSFHNFSCTPGLETLDQRFLQAVQLGADIAKVAVMPRNMDDVLTLLTATLCASHKLPIPLIGLSMGPYGAITRLFGWAFGSAMTYAVGSDSSAPGQIPIEDMKTVLEILHRSMRTW